MSGGLENVFQVYKDRFVEIDGYIAEGLKKAKESCTLRGILDFRIELFN